MRIKFLTGLILMLPLLGFSQGEWDNWYFGANAAMKFINGTPVALPPSPMGVSASQMTASVSDSAGNLLFYSNGYRVWSYNHSWMTNGNGLLGGVNYTRQPVLAVPVVGNKDQYYLFTVGRSESSGPLTGLHYSIIDMTLDGGYGAIMPGYKNIPIPTGDSAVNHLTAIRHQNNKDVWVVVFRHGYIRQYLAYLISESGISDPVVSGSSLSPVFYQNGSLRISQDGLNLVCSDSIAEVCYFNPATGTVTRRFTFLPWYMGLPAQADGMEFSVDSRYLYTIKVDGNLTTNTPLWQFDIQQPDSVSFIQSGVLIGTMSSGSIQMGPDGRIYLGNPTFPIDSLNRINNPSSPGTNCNYELNAVYLGGTNCNGSLPQFLQRYKAYIHSSGQCQGHPVTFTSDIWPPADTTRWNFGEPASGASNTSTLTTPTHLYANPGTYTVTLYVRHNDNRTDTTLIAITIMPSPVPVITGPATAAIGQTTNYTTHSGMTGYTWSVSSGGTITSGGTSTDNTAAVTWNTSGTHQVFVNYTSVNGCTGVSPAVINVNVGSGPPALYEYWFAAPAVTYQRVNWYNMNNPIAFYLMTAEGPATVTIDQPANPSFVPIIKTVNNDSAREVFLTPFIDMVENTPANTVLNRGLHITSDKQISVIYEVESPLNAVTYTLGGKNALGYEFIIPAQSHFSNHPDCSPPARNTFDIVASEDSTLVTILPKQPIIGHAAGDTFSVILNRGQTWSGRAGSGDSLRHLGGSFVFADKPVAVTVTDDAIFIPGNSESVDITGDQLMPRHLCGTEFIPVRYLDASKPKLLIYAFENGTHVVLTDTSYVLTADLNRGESTEMVLDIEPTLPISMGYAGYLVSNKPILVYQQTERTILFGGATQQAGACILPPINCAGSYRVCLPRTPPNGTGSGIYLNEIYWTIVTKNGNQGNFQVSGGFPVAVGGFQTVPGTNGAYVFGISNVSNVNGIIPNIIFTNSSARFQLISGSSTNNILLPASNFFKYSCYSDYATLSLGPDRSICPGDSVFLDAGFGLTSYLWSTGQTTQSIWVKTPGAYWVTTSVPECQLSDTIVISFYPNTPVNLGPDRSICAGDSALLNAGPGRLWYLWNTGATTQSIWASTSGTYWVKTSGGHCDVYDTVAVTNIPPPSITTTPHAKTICTGENTNIALSSTVTNTVFHWTATLISGNVTGFTADSGLVINQTLINIGTTTGVVTYHITPKKGDCAGPPVDYMVTVNTGSPVGVTISAASNNVCSGTQVTFTATPVNAGSNPTYQWKVNGLNAGTNSPTFTYVPANGDQVLVMCNSSLLICISNNPATSNAITMVVNPILPVGVVVAPSINPVCQGNSVTFTATVINGGAMPFYQWKVNGNNAGTNSPAFSYSPANGDQVIVNCTSSIVNCITNNPATSTPVTMVVNTSLPAGISILPSANPFCPGAPVTFTATPLNGGSDPSYQWKVNGINAGTNASSFSYNPSNNDSVRCVINSNLSCVTGNPASSAKIIMIGSLAPNIVFIPCFDTVTRLNAKPFKLKGGLPLGGSYSGPGVNSSTGMFTPSVAGIGVKTINYSYVNVYDCSASKSKSILVQPAQVFSCGSNLTDTRDNKVYHTVQIGTQCWMAANLNYGNTISSSLVQYDNCITEKYCYNNLTANCNQYGGFYQWDELMNYTDTPAGQGVCPPGWHVPTESDWTILFNYYQGNSRAGRPLQDTIINGFKALRSGVHYLNSSMSFLDFATLFWSSTPSGQHRALAHGMNDWNFSVSLYPALRTNAFPIRCLKD